MCCCVAPSSRGAWESSHGDTDSAYKPGVKRLAWEVASARSLEVSKKGLEEQ